MIEQTAAELRLAQVIVNALDLEDITAEEIDPAAPLFDPADENSLALDSIDALEISLAIAKEYNVQLKADDENNKETFYSLRTLNQYIESNS